MPHRLLIAPAPVIGGAAGSFRLAVSFVEGIVENRNTRPDRLAVVLRRKARPSSGADPSGPEFIGRRDHYFREGVAA